MVLLRHALLVAAALAVGCTFQFLEKGPYVETFDCTGCSAVELRGIEGAVDVRGSDGGDQVLIRGTRRALGSTRARAEENLERVVLEPHREGAALVLAFDPPFEMIGLLDLELTGPSEIPGEVGLEVDIVEGDISVSQVMGEVDLATGDGDVSVLGAGPGHVTAVSGRGRVAVEALGKVTIDANGQASLTVPEVESSPANIDTGGGPVVVQIVPQAMEILVQLDGGELTVDPALALEPVNQGADTEYLATDSADFEGPRKLIRVTSNGGNVDFQALP